ncbi:MAG: transcription termination/antitermination protein NusG [Bacilli bacterium]|nr:transcription termination/antitermination protein NusG [Bacilli bacterium]
MADDKIMAFTDSNTDVGDEAASKEQKLGEKAWYVVNTYSTHERKVAFNLQKRVETMGLENLIFRIIVAEQEVPVMDRETNLPTGKTRMKNLYPGYVFVEMIMTDYAWYVVRNTPGVTGFVGSSGKGTKPFPVPREQIEPVLKRMGMVDQSMYDRYNVNDYVKLIHGPLEGTEGQILSINKDTGIVEVETVFFGRTTRVEVDFSDIEKI